MTTLYGPQRERVLNALEVRQAAEGAPDYLDHLPESPEPPRRPTVGETLALIFNRSTIYETLTGRPAVDCTCRDCIDRAAGRHLRFSLAVAGVLLALLSIGGGALASTPY